MKKVTFYQLLVIVLLLVNVFLFFMGNRKGHHRPPHEEKHRPKYIVIERLNFNNEQVADYEQLIAEHEKEIKNLDRKLNYSKGLLYESLKDDSSEVDTDSLIQTIVAIQIEIENLHLNHFKDIKNICNDDQLNDFKILSKDLVKVFHRKPPAKRPH